MHSKNIDKCGKNPQSARRKPNYHTKCGKNCHKILSVYIYITHLKYLYYFALDHIHDLGHIIRRYRKVNFSIVFVHARIFFNRNYFYHLRALW